MAFILGGGNCRLSITEYGNPQGIPIIFLHGLSQSQAVWQLQIASELADEFRLITVDLRGHGLSEKPSGVYQNEQLWAADLHAIITQLQLDKPVLCAWSYAGLVVCDYLRCYGDTAIRGMVWIAACTEIGTAFSAAVAGPHFLSLLPELTAEQTPAFTRKTLQTFSRLLTYQALPEEEMEDLIERSMMVPAYVREQLTTRTVNNRDLYAQYQKPLLLIHGDHDAIMLPQSTKDQAKNIKQAKVSRYTNVGHMPFFEAADVFNEEIKQFVKKLS